jgi:glutamyl-tRNA(Gln) amidotransferase subunit D
MYSKRINDLLKKKGIEVGDRIRLVSGDSVFEGLLMPRPYSGDPDIIVLKLDSGYNTGLHAQSVELIAKAAPKKQDESMDEKPKEGGIAILGCGGTIASKIEYKTGAVYPSITPKELRSAFPSLGQWPIHSRQIFSLFSEDMNAHHWKLLADEIEHEIKHGSSGAVVMHGTDTMTYTSSVISYMFQNLPMPVVLVGSQRSSDRPSSENEMNLLNSVFAATQDVGEVMVCMHANSSDEFCHLHRGTRVRKMHTSARDAFRSIGMPPLFVADYRTRRFDALTEHKKRSKPEDLVIRKQVNGNVALVYIHPGIKASFISKLDDYDGVVLAGTGLGHAAMNAFHDKSVHGIHKPVTDLIGSGIPVVMSSQCIEGRVCMRVYTNGRLLRDAGVIGDGADWTPEAAYTKLCWALGQTKKMDEIEKLMMTDIAGEITPRSVPRQDHLKR